MWEDPNLNITEKAMLAEIESLDSDGEGCRASNSYFAKFFSLKERQIQNVLGSLKLHGLIRMNGAGKQRRVFVNGAKNCVVEGAKNCMVSTQNIAGYSGSLNINDNKADNTAPAAAVAPIAEEWDPQAYLESMMENRNETTVVLGVIAAEMLDAGRLVLWASKEEAQAWIKANVKWARDLQNFGVAKIRQTVQYMATVRINNQPMTFSVATILRWITRQEVYR